MAASGALGPFLQTMLGLRAQRLQEEEIKAKLAAEQQKELADSISKAGAAFQTQMKEMKSDAAANKLGKEYFGGGGATVGDLMKGVAGASAGAGGGMGNLGTAGSAPAGDFSLPSTRTEGGWQGGGQAELENRIKLETLKQTIQDKKAADIWKQRNFDLATKSYNLRAAADQRAQAKTSYANQLMEKAPEKAKDIFNASKAIQEKSGNLIEGMNAAMAADDYDKYLQLAREHAALNDAHAGMKLTSALTPTPTFVGAKQAKIMANPMGAEGGTDPEVSSLMNLKGTPAQPIREWGPDQIENLQLAQQKAQGQMSRGYRPPGGGPIQAPPNAPAVTQLDPSMVGRVSQATPGGGGYTQAEAQQIMGGPAAQPGQPAPGAQRVSIGPKGKAIWDHKSGHWVDEQGNVLK